MYFTHSRGRPAPSHMGPATGDLNARICRRSCSQDPTIVDSPTVSVREARTAVALVSAER